MRHKKDQTSASQPARELALDCCPLHFTNITMGNRLTQIATRTGDDGTTGLGNNTRVPKNHARMQAMGDVDELNSHIGLLLCEDMPDAVRQLLVDVQHQLFNLGGELSIPGFELLKDDGLLQLDEALATHNAAPINPLIQPSLCRAFIRASLQSRHAYPATKKPGQSAGTPGALPLLPATRQEVFRTVRPAIFLTIRPRIRRAIPKEWRRSERSEIATREKRRH